MKKKIERLEYDDSCDHIAFLTTERGDTTLELMNSVFSDGLIIPIYINGITTMTGILSHWFVSV